ncbi:enoyl-CoA hydratase-related protein [Sphingomonas sp.]|uniref:enoyl-CoA hydratase/isomerase family protein n=1 Tax=Sphingomonas sp. TaxID=28214 RepID=UPI0025FA68D2|nr:enoyl-CoA hydratase-related protein [Sphingomonas sp.]
MKDQGGASSSVASGVATILFDRRAARNAMLQNTWGALPGLLANAEADPTVGVIVLRGADGDFGAGNDIAEFGRLRTDAAKCRDYGRTMANAMTAVESASKPVVAAVEGNCYGASVALALAADFRLAAADARFAITPAKLGAVYLRSDLHRLVAAIGQGHARRMIYTAGPVGAAEAVAIGLAEQLIPADTFDASLGLITSDILRGSTFTLRTSKRVLGQINHCKVPAEDEESLGCFVDAMQGADFAEGYSAFMDKRSPVFVRP